MPAKTHLIIADPWSTLEYETETTLLLIRAGQALGLKFYWATPQQIYFAQNKLMVAKPQPVHEGASHLLAAQDDAPLSQYSGVHWRTDPPITLETMRLWSLLSAAGRGCTFYNTPQSLLQWNEKYAALRYPSWAVTSLVASTLPLLNEAAKSGYTKEKRFVFKPAGEAASRGVHMLSRQNVLNEKMFSTAGPWPVLQPYDPGILNGETRLFLIAGKLVGSLVKIPQKASPIMGWERSSEKPTVKPCQPTALQKTRALTIAKDLKKEGVHFSTIDFIGGRILEINVTSPGLLHGLGDGSLPAARHYWQSINKP